MMCVPRLNTVVLLILETAMLSCLLQAEEPDIISGSASVCKHKCLEEPLDDDLFPGGV